MQPTMSSCSTAAVLVPLFGQLGLAVELAIGHVDLEAGEIAARAAAGDEDELGGDDEGEADREGDARL